MSNEGADQPALMRGLFSVLVVHISYKQFFTTWLVIYYNNKYTQTLYRIIMKYTVHSKWDLKGEAR